MATYGAIGKGRVKDVIYKNNQKTKMQDIINTASTTFTTTTGFSLSSVIEFMQDQVLLVLGTGLAFFQAMLPWIVALAIIAAIVYFTYRAFRFFRG